MLLPGNVADSKSGTQSSNLKEGELGFTGRKKGRKMVYTDARESIGRTRSVPSPGPVLERDVHPCHARKIEHALLSEIIPT